MDEAQLRDVRVCQMWWNAKLLVERDMNTCIVIGTTIEACGVPLGHHDDPTKGSYITGSNVEERNIEDGESKLVDGKPCR